MKRKLLPIRTPVFDLFNGGWTEIETVIEENQKYPYKCKNGYWYSETGKYSNQDTHPCLSLTEYTLENGGFTPLSSFDFDAPKKGDFGYFWDAEKSNDLSYSKLINHKKKEPYPFENMTGACYLNFSIEIPEFFKNK